MKTILLVFLLLPGCASRCQDCMTLTPTQLFIAVEKAWAKGYSQGFDDGEDSADSKRLKSL